MAVIKFLRYRLLLTMESKQWTDQGHEECSMYISTSKRENKTLKNASSSVCRYIQETKSGSPSIQRVATLYYLRWSTLRALEDDKAARVTRRKEAEAEQVTPSPELGIIWSATVQAEQNKDELSNVETVAASRQDSWFRRCRALLKPQPTRATGLSFSPTQGSNSDIERGDTLLSSSVCPNIWEHCLAWPSTFNSFYSGQTGTWTRSSIPYGPPCLCGTLKRFLQWPSVHPFVMIIITGSLAQGMPSSN